MGCHPSHWRTPSFFKMVKTTNQNIMNIYSDIYGNIWDNPSHWLIFFKLVIAPPTSVYIYNTYIYIFWRLYSVAHPQKKDTRGKAGAPESRAWGPWMPGMPWMPWIQRCSCFFYWKIAIEIVENTPWYHGIYGDLMGLYSDLMGY